MSLDLNYFSGGPRERVLRAVLEAGHRVRHVFVNDPARWPKVRQTLDMARAVGIGTTIIRTKSDLATVGRQLRNATGLSAGFAYLFPGAILDAMDICLNVHGSLLPRYAGARTLAWAIEHGQRESGVTVHMIDQGMDTGPILLQRAFPLSPFETTRSLARKTSEFEPQVVVDALKLLEVNGRVAFQPQSGSCTLLPNRVPEHSEIDPKRPLAELINAIRASDPDHYPAYFYHQGVKVCIRLWRPDKPPDENDLI